MDQSIVTIFSNSGMLGVFALIGMQGYQMFLDSQKNNQLKQITDFQAQIDLLKTEYVQNKTMIINLQQEVYQLRQENGELRGLLQAQEDREDLVSKYVKKQSKTVLKS